MAISKWCMTFSLPWINTSCRVGTGGGNASSSAHIDKAHIAYTRRQYERLKEVLVVEADREAVKALIAPYASKLDQSNENADDRLQNPTQPLCPASSLSVTSYLRQVGVFAHLCPITLFRGARVIEPS